MTTEYSQQLKQLFRSNTIVNIKLGISLALGQGYSWNYIAEKCLEEWLLFPKWEPLTTDDQLFYSFIPNERIEYKPGRFCFDLVMNYDNTYEYAAILDIDDETNVINRHVKKIYKLEREEIINTMEEFLKLIYDNEHEHNNM